MNSAATTVLLPVALAIVMFGLGLSLTVDDFRRVRQHTVAVAVALLCQVLVLPLVCLGLVTGFGLDPVLAVGMLLLAASPGGPTANLFSHLFRGDVALNITLTAVNSVLAVVTLPLVINASLRHFRPDIGGDAVGLQFGKAVQVFAIVLVPVVLGMVVRSHREGFARVMDKPVRILSISLLVLIIVGTAAVERGNIVSYLSRVGVVVALFCVCSLAVGYFVPRVAGVARPQALACSMEIGIHNSALAMTIAISVLGSVDLAVAPAVYGVTIFPFAALFGYLITRVGQRELAPA